MRSHQVALVSALALVGAIAASGCSGSKGSTTYNIINGGGGTGSSAPTALVFQIAGTSVDAASVAQVLPTDKLTFQLGMRLENGSTVAVVFTQVVSTPQLKIVSGVNSDLTVGTAALVSGSLAQVVFTPTNPQTANLPDSVNLEATVRYNNQTFTGRQLIQVVNTITTQQPTSNMGGGGNTTTSSAATLTSFEVQDDETGQDINSPVNVAPTQGTGFKIVGHYSDNSTKLLVDNELKDPSISPVASTTAVIGIVEKSNNTIAFLSNGTVGQANVVITSAVNPSVFTNVLINVTAGGSTTTSSSPLASLTLKDSSGNVLSNGGTTQVNQGTSFTVVLSGALQDGTTGVAFVSSEVLTNQVINSSVSGLASVTFNGTNDVLTINNVLGTFDLSLTTTKNSASQNATAHFQVVASGGSTGGGGGGGGGGSGVGSGQVVLSLIAAPPTNNPIPPGGLGQLQVSGTTSVAGVSPDPTQLLWTVKAGDVYVDFQGDIMPYLSAQPLSIQALGLGPSTTVNNKTYNTTQVYTVNFGSGNGNQSPTQLFLHNLDCEISVDTSRTFDLTMGHNTEAASAVTLSVLSGSNSISAAMVSDHVLNNTPVLQLTGGKKAGPWQVQVSVTNATPIVIKGHTIVGDPRLTRLTSTPNGTDNVSSPNQTYALDMDFSTSPPSLVLLIYTKVSSFTNSSNIGYVGPGTNDVGGYSAVSSLPKPFDTCTDDTPSQASWCVFRHNFLVVPNATKYQMPYFQIVGNWTSVSDQTTWTVMTNQTQDLYWGTDSNQHQGFLPQLNFASPIPNNALATRQDFNTWYQSSGLSITPP